MYVKYLMVGFLVIFAMSMLFQFCAYLLSNIADLAGEAGDEADADAQAPSGSAVTG